MSKRIQLTHGLFATVDDDMYDYLMQWKWCAQKAGNNFYAARYEGKKYTLMHRVIMNTPKGLDVDHIDMDGLNNTRGNLRNCTRSQNMQNTRMQSNNTSGYKGVSFDKYRNKWAAYIKIGKNHTLLGRFSTAKDAALAYDQAAQEHYGEFARTNF